MSEAKKNSILIVDDEKSNIIALTHILSPEYTIYVARDGQDAIEVAEKDMPDLILLDILMPDMDGYAVISALKSSEKTRGIPVIFITGLDDADEEEKGLALGATDYITKPFRSAIIKLRVQSQLKIVNHTRALDRRFQQQALMTKISQLFLAETYIDSLFTDTLRMIGEFMNIARATLFTLEDDGVTLICKNEWLKPGYGLEPFTGGKLKLEDSLLSIVDGLLRSTKGAFCLPSDDPFVREAMKPYQRHFPDYIATPVLVKGEIRAVLEFSREADGREWNESEINLAMLVSGVFSGIFERDVAEHSSRVKSEFLSRMSHEMRTPMNAIMGMTQIIQMQCIPDDLREYIDGIDTASNQLLMIIDEVLDISDIEKGRLNLTDSEFHFTRMLEGVLDAISADMEEKRHTVTTDIDPSIPDRLTGDEKRLAQVIGSLLSNACKFTRENGLIQVKASAVEIKHKMLTLQIEVIDNGIGISKEQMEILFIPFEQVDGGIRREFGGAGLGLAISKHIVEMMNGGIWVESEPGKGSKFAFTVKIKTKIEAAEEKCGRPGAFEGKTLLLVEDVETNRDIVTAMLVFEDMRIEIEHAANGQEAVDLFAANPAKYDVIIMDINMPEMDGVEATRRIRALEAPEGAKVPIIAVTANVSAPEKKVYLEAGMNGHIGKPINFDLLFQMLHKYLDRGDN